MMEIIIYSKTLDSLNKELLNTSSKIFEFDFAKSLSQFAQVSVLSYSAPSDMYDKGIKLISLNKEEKLYSAMSTVITNNSIFMDSKKIIIAFGYDYSIFKQLNKLSKMYKAKLISYTFDTHKGAITTKSLFKKNIANFYFKLGIRYLSNLDGIILLNEEAYREMKLSIPFLISKVGINENEIISEVYKRKANDIYKVIYSGSLIEYNSIEILMKTMDLLEGTNITLDIYGDGPLRKYVEECAQNSNNISYHGIVTNNEVKYAIETADLLINLRDVNNYISKFAFPSKLIQYMASGIPVLTTKVLSEDQFNDATFTVDDLNPETIKELILYIENQSDLQITKSECAKRYVENQFLWDNIIVDVIEFLDYISQNKEIKVK